MGGGGEAMMQRLNEIVSLCESIDDLDVVAEGDIKGEIANQISMMQETNAGLSQQLRSSEIALRDTQVSFLCGHVPVLHSFCHELMNNFR